MRMPGDLIVVILLLGVVFLVGGTIVIRSTTMRELLVRSDRLTAARDSLAVRNLESRLRIVSLSRPDDICRALEHESFSTPDDSTMRFILYPGSVPAGKGALTERLASWLTDDGPSTRLEGSVSSPTTREPSVDLPGFNRENGDPYG